MTMPCSLLDVIEIIVATSLLERGSAGAMLGVQGERAFTEWQEFIIVNVLVC
jgi:hypothetical protein